MPTSSGNDLMVSMVAETKLVTMKAAGLDLAATDITLQLGGIDRPGPVIGPLLEQLAFESDVDLERARQLLVAIWNVQHAGPPPSTSTGLPPRSSVSRVATT